MTDYKGDESKKIEFWFLELKKYMYTKGQLISKCLLGCLQFLPKNKRKQVNLRCQIWFGFGLQLSVIYCYGNKSYPSLVELGLICQSIAEKDWLHESFKFQTALIISGFFLTGNQLGKGYKSG